MRESARPASAAKKPLRDFVGAHFQAEKRHRRAGLSGIGRKVHSERRFTNSRASSQDNKVARAQAAEELVHVDEAGRHTLEHAFTVAHFGDFPHSLLRAIPECP